MRALLLGLLVILPAPLAAQEPTIYDQAVAARQAGEHAEAVALLDRWIAEHPEDSDALVQRGYALLALGRNEPARADFAAALAIAPDYVDASNGLALARTRQPEQRRGFLIAGGAWSALEGDRLDWWEASLVGEAPVSDRLAMGGRAGWFRRFGLEDVEIEGRIAAHPSDNLWLRASIGGTPSADFRPETAVALGGDLRVAAGPQATVLSLDASWQRFPLQEVVTVTPGITQYLGDGRVWTTLRGIGIVPEGGDLEVGVLGRIDYAPSDRRRYFLGVVNGPDTDLGIVSRVTSIFTGGELPLTATFSLLPSLSHEWRELGGDRTEFRLELKAVF